MAEAFAVNVATNFVTELIKSLIKITLTAVRCQVECRNLAKTLEAIQPGVEKIERQLQELQEHGLTAELSMVQDWLKELKEELHLASIKVHKSNTISKFKKLNVIGTSNLSKKITALNMKITKLADKREVLNVQLMSLLKEELSHHPSKEWRKLMDEKNAILYREEHTRLSELYNAGCSHSGSGPSGHGSPSR